MHTVLVLGGYGFFGARISEALASDGAIRLLVAGRDGRKAEALASRLRLPPGQAGALDARDPELAQRLLAQLGSVERVMTADAAGLSVVRGIGSKKAARIRDIVSG